MADFGSTVFVADGPDNIVFAVNTQTGHEQALAGTGIAGDEGIGGPATRAELADPVAVAVDAHGDVYVANAE